MSLGMRVNILVPEIGKSNIVFGVEPGHIRTLHFIECDIDINKYFNNYSAQSRFRKLILK